TSTSVFDFSQAEFLVTGTAEFRGGTVTIANPLPAELTIPIVSGTMLLNADQTLDSVEYLLATVGGSGDVVFSGNSLLNGLTLEGTGTATVAANADLSVAGFNATFHRSVENFGRVRTNSSRITLNETFINRSGGQLVVAGGGIISGSASILNEGTFSKSGTTLSQLNVEIVNTGDFLVADGELKLTEGSTTTSIDVPEGAALRFNRTFTFSPGTALTGAGSVEF
ncbi:hypothetical protein NG895_00005, partial [Aeoliella sp. ICT_H6.2]